MNYAIITCDERDHYRMVYESLFVGNLITTGKEKWDFYKATSFELPSDEDLKNLKGIVFPGSKHSVYDES